MRGLYGSGGAIVIIEEADRLNLSTTPVREALACLCGEGLVERAPRAGYLAPRLDAALLRDRFWLRLRVLTTSLELTAALSVNGAPAAEIAETGVGEMFDRLVRETGNRALVEAFRRVDAQLRTLGDAESRVFADARREADRLVGLGSGGSRDALRAAIEAFHRRRMDNAALLVLAVERKGFRPRDGEVE